MRDEDEDPEMKMHVHGGFLLRSCPILFLPCGNCLPVITPREMPALARLQVRYA